MLPQDLAFRKGDILTIFGDTRNKNTWWTAVLNDKRGMIPSTYVKIL
jgi:hypothetical protein